MFNLGKHGGTVIDIEEPASEVIDEIIQLNQRVRNNRRRLSRIQIWAMIVIVGNNFPTREAPVMDLSTLGQASAILFTSNPRVYRDENKSADVT